ncbi:MAG TPA: hypothetical protein VGX23_11535 [Actinocrinis sp.]|nr:hypothetical protein [Actinocrinis sp.]
MAAAFDLPGQDPISPDHRSTRLVPAPAPAPGSSRSDLPDLPDWCSDRDTWAPAGWTDPATSAFRAGYTDPARVQTLAAGPLFDVLSVEMTVGLEAAQLLLADHQPLGPVALDNRLQVRRVGFLLPPDTFRRASGFAWWCRSHAMRTVSHGDVVALPPLIGTGSARFQWLVAPGARGPHGTHGVCATDTAALLSRLRQALRGTRRRT